MGEPCNCEQAPKASPCYEDRRILATALQCAVYRLERALMDIGPDGSPTGTADIRGAIDAANRALDATDMRGYDE